MSNTPIPTFPLSKQQLLIATNIFFWLGFIAFDTITTAGIVNGYVGFTFQRAVIHAFILTLLVYPNLYWLYPMYFTKGKYLNYAIAALLLIGFNTALRTGMDNLYLKWFLGGESFSTATGKMAYNSMVNSGFIENGQFVLSYYFGMVLGTTIVFFIISPIKLVEDWYEKHLLSYQILENQVQLQETRIKFLKAQTDPHFLINALSGVYNLALLESKKIDVAILRLSELMAYLLGRGKEHQIALRHEIHFIQNFIDFHQAVNPDPIDLDFQHNISPAQLEAVMIPPMLLQPFFENALKHGNAADDPEGWIKSQLLLEDDQLYFNISNSIKSSKRKTVSHHVGLQNVQEKLDLYFPNAKHKLVTQAEESRYSVKLTLDLS